MDYIKKAQRIVERIERDVRSRRGLRHEFELIEAGVQEEIRDAWREIVLEELTPRHHREAP